MNKNNYALYLSGILSESDYVDDNLSYDIESPEFKTWIDNFEKKLHKEDGYNIFIGRIFSILDELGETADLDKYLGSNISVMHENYERLLRRYVQENNPRMYSAFKAWNE